MHKSLDEFEFLEKFPNLATELSALEGLKNQCGHSMAFIFYLIFVILAGNEDNHKILNEFAIQPDQTTTVHLPAFKHLEKSHRQLTTELAALENLKKQCLQFFSVAIDLILLNLQVRRTCIIFCNLFELEFWPD